MELLAFPLPMEVLRLMFGVDAETWSRRSGSPLRPLGSYRRIRAIHGVLADFLAAYMATRPGTQSTDLLSALMVSDGGGQQLSDFEQTANAVLLVVAGFDNIVSLIALAVRTLILHPDQLAQLRSDWSLAPNAIDEVLRFEPPALFTSRFASESITVADTVIPAGSNVLFSFWRPIVTRPVSPSRTASTSVARTSDPPPSVPVSITAWAPSSPASRPRWP